MSSSGDPVSLSASSRSAACPAQNHDLTIVSSFIAHDLRESLRHIGVAAHLLDARHASRLDRDGMALIADILVSTQRMGCLFDSLLRFARSTDAVLGLSAVDMRALVDQAICLLIYGRERTVEFEIGQLPACRGDSEWLAQVWHNLLSNAVKYSAHVQHPRVWVGGYQQGAETIYFVRDNGVGFDMKRSQKLFGMFQRLHDAGEFEGAGIGLAIVRSIVARHRGRVWAEGATHAGATFYFALPRSTVTEPQTL